MRSLFIISFFILLISKPLLSQEDGVTRLSDISIGVDAFGAFFTPIVSNFNSHGQSNVIRPSAEIHYQFSNNFYTALAIEYNNIQVGDLENGFTDYRMKGFAFKPSIVYQRRDGLFYVGLGLIIGSQTEEGYIQIPSVYFTDYREYKRHSINPTGALMKTGVNVALSQRISLKLEVNFITIGGTPEDESPRNNESPVQKIEYFVGSNKLSSFNKSNVSLSARSFCYLTYRF
tara:strand:- start:12611 stop:13303 length:693 start_codon:yes stop_codon:yes gene_type:complete